MDEKKESFRLSGYLLFRKNLLDLSLFISVLFSYTICRLIVSSDSSVITFILVFSCIFMSMNYHVESYRAFLAINSSVGCLKKDKKLREAFLATHLGCNPTIDDNVKSDSFHWINRIIKFFWPYLSHVIHYELNEFFRDEIDSGKLARSNEELKRFFYAIIKQLDTNILVIEKCQLGHQTPIIKDLSVSEKENSDQQHRPHSKYKKEKLLVYNVNIEYNGDMNIAVIYKYFCCLSSRFGLKDLFLHFKLRFIVGPIKENIPFIDQVSLTLLELPEFGYKGIALAELAELKIVRGVINRLITKSLLYPRFVSVSLHELLDTLINGPKTRQRRKELRLRQEQQKQKEAETRAKREVPRSNDGRVGPEVSTWTRFYANALLLCCFCSNFFLKRRSK